jgi:hypothetical protein
MGFVHRDHWCTTLLAQITDGKRGYPLVNLQFAYIAIEDPIAMVYR